MRTKSKLGGVTDQRVQVVSGTTGRPLQAVSAYPLDPPAFTYNAHRLTFSDGQTVFLTRYQADRIADAAKVDASLGIAQEVVKRTGLAGEEAVTIMQGGDPSTARRRMG
jgi:hypothetical protein